ncbi:choline dehydrogenase-like flavoprotein [Chitinophaga terrae (ex Kim and Jung 2007)]|uniref:GMC oxidoreductase n=1 Tax=Chitinophaga terrae (ex Kim and Jung 2007) TaxID=408074 RepID=UPI0027815943|nr:GMC family oxidoreductase [Chitinophaga terrae (ex Kim and Jung 2007)]MDQ0110064.1 choline dehydrogenase-like flavoprotein [Chitinophaga terrae (ex Kim and Jung 2007)]
MLTVDSVQINTRGTAANTYDVIVIGSGISGGWAAKEFCEKGLKTLVLERGRDVKHLKDYPTAAKNPWDFPHRGRVSLSESHDNPIAARCYAFNETSAHFIVKDKEHPYVQEKPFDWIRGYQVGGKSLIWGRQTQRWSRFEFESPARDGYAVEWPIGYNDLAPWYSHVEKFVGISGNKDGLVNLPDGEFLPPWELNCGEKHIQQKVKEHYNDRHVIIGRCAHLTKPQDVHYQQGRNQCQARSLCERGCPFGGYFSSNSSTLPWAAKTGNLTLKPDSVVHSVIYDEAKGKATGVRVIDAHTKKATEYFAKVIFVNAGTLNTNLILLNSVSNRFANGLGNENDLLGRYIAFHNYRGSIGARMEGFEDKYYYGRRPTAAFIPSFRNVFKRDMPFLGGYMMYYTVGRNGWGDAYGKEGIGAAWKDGLGEPGGWSVYMGMQGETIPKKENHVRLSKEQRDEWGMPLLVTAVGYDDNDIASMKDFQAQGVEMLEKAGCKDIYTWDTNQAPGLDIHEMGGVRMGKDPKTSLLNKWNQLHVCRNVFVTDGACMTSVGNQNPSLTYMALTARAVDYAVEELKKGNL